VFRALESAQGEHLAHKAARSPESMAVLQRGGPDGGFRTTLRAWQAARRWQKQLPG
jgi:phytoene synthase